MTEENNSIQTEQAENSKQQEQPKNSYAVRPDHRHHRRPCSDTWNTGGTLKAHIR